jgi:hypothetical protein
MVGLQIEALVIQTFGLLQARLIGPLTTRIVVCGCEIVICIRVSRVRRDSALEFAHRCRGLALLEESDALCVLPVSGELAARQSNNKQRTFNRRSTAP